MKADPDTQAGSFFLLQVVFVLVKLVSKIFILLLDCVRLQGQDHQAVEHTGPVQVYHPGKYIKTLSSSVADPYHFYTDPDPGCEKIVMDPDPGSGSEWKWKII